MTAVKLKICGMKYNTAEVAALHPEYLGFIFYEGSPRNFEAASITSLPGGIKKVGVFVNTPVSEVIKKVTTFQLDVVQLHGDESIAYVQDLSNTAALNATPEFKIWKVFSVKDTFDFSVLKLYENSVNAFLFDTKGKEKGGNGFTFDWELLKEYPSKKPFIVSGGIGIEEIPALKELLKSDLPIMAIDVNSRFEDSPGLKNIKKLQAFKKQLDTIS